MKNPVKQAPAKRLYSAPVLILHGDLRTLTRSGSGVLVEQSKGSSGQCKPNTKRSRC
ncbi:MAG: lasso RiPP family leader peptide-containing protein [Hydrogenophaga sp.]|nr:lasso RiPP family leader peptide-containing protein [Hydrogenophaga sp.]